MKVYGLMGGVYGHGVNLHDLYKYKKDAISYIRSLGGFKHNKQHDLYENDEESYVYRIDHMEVKEYPHD